jgi:hypothetical protein
VALGGSVAETEAELKGVLETERKAWFPNAFLRLLAIEMGLLVTVLIIEDLVEVLRFLAAEDNPLLVKD